MKKGLVQVYTGDGKGKTTASLGLAWRALGHGLKVCYIQFVKGSKTSGEQLLAARFTDQLTFVQCSADARGKGRKSRPGEAWWMQAPGKEDKACAEEAVELSRNSLKSGKYDIVICDEINVACDLGLIDVEAILSLIIDKPAGVELVLTGRNAKPEVVAAADLVTEMRQIKHPFNQGVPARKGIEF